MESNESKPDEEKSEAAAPGEAKAEEKAEGEQTAPVDALEKTNEELGEDVVDATGTVGALDGGDKEAKPVKGPNAIKKLLKKVDIYLVLFILIIVIAAATSIVSYLNSKKAPPQAAIVTQKLTQDDLKKLSTSDTTIGNAAQTLTVQGNAIFAGQVLIKSDLGVAGNIQLGGSLQAPALTVSGKTNLGDTQINNLQVATNVLVQGTTTLKDLNVSGNTAFNGPVTASQITVTKLILSGNAVLQIPNHISFTGASPSRTTTQATLGAGGTASINGSDTTGTININTGNGPAAGCFVNITFNRPFTSPPHVLVSPVGAAAGLLEYYVNRSTTGFSLCTNNSPQGNQVFAFDYFITD